MYPNSLAWENTKTCGCMTECDDFIKPKVIKRDLGGTFMRIHM